MIVLTKLDGALVALNDDLILFCEKTPDTLVTMSTGQRLMVRETLDDIIERIAQFRSRSLPSLVPTGAVSHG